MYFHTNSIPVCAFPYLLAFTTNTIEIRLVVNANLVHTLVLPKVCLISAKVRWKIILLTYSFIYASFATLSRVLPCNIPRRVTYFDGMRTRRRKYSGQHNQCSARCEDCRVYNGFPVFWLAVFAMAWYKYICPHACCSIVVRNLLR